MVVVIVAIVVVIELLLIIFVDNDQRNELSKDQTPTFPKLQDTENNSSSQSVRVKA